MVKVKGFIAKTDFPPCDLEKYQRVWVIWEYENFVEITFKDKITKDYNFSVISKWKDTTKREYNELIGQDGLQIYKVRKKFADKLLLSYS